MSFCRLAVSTYPSFETLVKNPQNPDRLLSLTPAYRSFLSLMLIWFVTVFLTLFVNLEAYRFGLSFSSAFPLRWLALIPLALLLEIVRRKYNQRYDLGSDKASQKNGLLSLTYNETVIEYGDVRTINVIQSFWGRVLNYGTLEIGTAAQEDSELVLTGVISPEELSDLVDRLRTYARDLDLHGHEEIRTND